MADITRIMKLARDGGRWGSALLVTDIGLPP
jgi:hypothetical protein